jgi:hypothetical protein
MVALGVVSLDIAPPAPCSRCTLQTLHCRPHRHGRTTVKVHHRHSLFSKGTRALCGREKKNLVRVLVMYSGSMFHGVEQYFEKLGEENKEG